MTYCFSAAAATLISRVVFWCALGSVCAGCPICNPPRVEVCRRFSHVSHTQSRSEESRSSQLDTLLPIVPISTSSSCPLCLASLCVFLLSYAHYHTLQHTHTHQVSPHMRWWNSWRTQEICFCWNRSGLRDNWALVGERRKPCRL